MSCIVYQTNKRTGITYAYESVSYWDPDKKQPRSKRRYIGRVDSETGEIVSSKRSKVYQPDPAPADISGTVEALRKELVEKDTVITSLQKELSALAAQYTKAVELVENIASLANGFTEKKNEQPYPGEIRFTVSDKNTKR